MSRQCAIMSSNASDDCSLDGIEDPNKSTFLADAEKNQHSSSFTPAFTSHSSVSYPVVNHLLTTVQSCSAEDSATSDYESTCSDSSFHFRHIIMSPRVLSPDSQTPSSGVVSQKVGRFYSGYNLILSTNNNEKNCL